MTSLLARLFKTHDDNVPESLRCHKTVRKRINVKESIRDTDFIAFDTELTGLDYKKDTIIAMGAVKMRGGRIFPGHVFHRLVRPESRLKSESVLVHGLTHSDLAAADNLQAAITDFLDFIGDAVLIGHFVFIDLRFLNRALKRCCGLSLQNPVVDTSSLHEWLYDNDDGFARHYRGMTVKKDLFSMAKKYGIKVQKRHDALHDAYLTAQLFQRFIHFLPHAGVNTLDELLMVSKY